MLRKVSLGILLVLASLAHSQERVRDVIYAKQGGVAYTMDVFKPKTASGIGLIWIVSGGWFSNHDMISADLAKPFTDQGMTVFEVVHGSQPKYIMPEIIKQLQTSVRFIRLNASTYGVDPARLGIFGASSGGHLTLMVSGTGDAGDPNGKTTVDKTSSKLQAAVAFFPPTDFEHYGGDAPANPKSPVLGIFLPVFGIKPTSPPEAWLPLAHEYSPINFVTSDFPPTLLVHGDKDMLVPVQQSKVMAAALTAKNVSNKLIIVPNGGHDMNTAIYALKDVIDWFMHNLPSPVK